MANSKACAACKYQRRKCTQTCELASYFPASRFVEFVNAQHTFGMSNIEKILATVEPDQRPAAAETILFEGNIWRNNPSVGCLGVTRFLREQVDFHKKELEMTNLYLAFYRELKQQLDSLKIQSAREAPVVPDQFPRITAEMKKYEEGYIYMSSLEDAQEKAFVIGLMQPASFSGPGESRCGEETKGDEVDR
ncbi:LOB domain-containing protein 22-like [Pyrus x bretschneideri]|uniref:LOB domain-containing protein 22-like n=1 Tax=Pyrus x bretschneideri TaxID=225117 RepID=UPI00202EAA0E|nr:LOB domain-containing protein 22-like [Pyrus x bretschneideri]